MEEKQLQTLHRIMVLLQNRACPNINIIAPEIAEDLPVSVKGVN